ncbi:hypothetical protein ACNNLQ_05370 [Aerococcus urinaeequi]|uniref:hypothetical protein n=1 Tax=Aerococcus urinaeequi TaxID=51665 RepID=UPI003ADA0B9F
MGNKLGGDFEKIDQLLGGTTTEHFTDNVRTLDYFWEKFYQRGAQENQERSQERGR